MIEILFWLSLFFVGYVYIGYPLAIALIALVRNHKVKKAPIRPFISVLIAAYNEKDVIESTLRNKLEQDYPEDRFEIMVVSDGSTDGTDEIVRNFADSRVRLLRQEPRAGKTSALNLAMANVHGEIIVFSDANSIYAPDTLKRLVENFDDPTVGYVTGKMIYTTQDGSIVGDGCSSYMKYENILRKIETRLGSIVGVDGGVDAVRKKLYQPMSNDQLPDLVLPLKIVAQGYRVVYEPEATLWETSLKEIEDEYRMRVRVSLRALWALFHMRKMLWDSKNKLFGWQIWSHKVLRYFCYIFLVINLMCNIILLKSGVVYWLFFLLQIVLYIGSLCEPALARRGIKIKILRFARYFLLINLAAAHATIKFLTGQKQVLWTPRKG